MANIYELASIMAGDPQEAQKMAQEEAMAGLLRYRREKREIDEINAALKEAEKRAKESGGWGQSLLSSLAGGLIAGATGGAGLALTPWISTALGALASGGTSYALEKSRQDKLDATGELEKLKKKHAGTDLGEDIGDSIDIIDEALEDRLEMTAMTDLASQAIMPTKIGAGKMPVKVPTVDMGAAVDVAKGKIQEGALGALGKMVEPVKELIPGADKIFDIFPKDVYEKLGSTGASFEDVIGTKTLNIPIPTIDIGFDEGAFDMLMPDKLGELLTDSQIGKLKPALDNNLLAGLLKTQGRDAYVDALPMVPQLSKFTRPQYINPYARGGYYR